MAITHHWCTPGDLTNGAVYVVRPWPRTVFRHGAAHRKGSNGLCPRGCCGVIPITVACLDTMICTRPVLSTASLVPSEISHCFFGWRHFCQPQRPYRVSSASSTFLVPCPPHIKSTGFFDDSRCCPRRLPQAPSFLPSCSNEPWPPPSSGSPSWWHALPSSVFLQAKQGSTTPWSRR